MSGLQVYKEKKIELLKVLEAHKSLLEDLPPKLQDKFKSNFLELVHNDYLLNNVDKRLILKLAIDLTKIGLNINPFAKEVYIVPFKTKINNQTIMFPQAIIPEKGIAEIYLRADFLLKIYKVWDLGDVVKSEKEMSYKELSLIDETNIKFVEKNFIGWDVVLIDLLGKLPEQKEFVSYKYAKAATKNMEVPEEFYLEGLVHKAVRKASKRFRVPKERFKDVVEQVEYANEVLIDEIPNNQNKQQSSSTQAIDPLELAKPKQEEDIKAAEVVKEPEKVKIDDFRNLYKGLNKEQKTAYLAYTQGVDLSKLSEQELQNFYKEVKEHVGA